MLIVCNGLILILLFLIAITDIRERRIPNAMLGILLACIVVSRVLSEHPTSLTSLMAGSLGIALFLLVLSWIRPGAFGLGDVKLMLVTGVHLGLEVWYAFAVGVVFAAIFCLGGLLLKKLSMKSEIPFGPFLCIGIGIMIFAGL